MGKHFWIRNVDDELEDKQPGCVWGLVHALDYHHWHSNGRKKIHRRKYEGQTQPKSYGSPKTKLLDPKKEENGRHKAGFSVPPRLQRTYSIHHLELESSDSGLHKIITDWKHPIIFLPDNGATQSLDKAKKDAFDQQEVYNCDSMDITEHELEKDPDVLEMFKVDMDLFIKTTKGSDNLLASNETSKLRKSKSFPVADLLERRKLKPSKLEHKKNEVWSFREGDKLRAFNRAPQLVHSEKISTGTDEYNITRSYGVEVKLHSSRSRSLKSINEYGRAPLYFRRIRSLSHFDYYFSDIKFGVPGNDFSADGSNTSLEESGSSVSRENAPLDANEASDGQKECCISDSETSFQEMVSHPGNIQISEGLDLECDCFYQNNSSFNSHEQKSLYMDSSSSFNSMLNFEKIENADTNYVRHILEKSGIVENGSHSSDQPLSLELFEEVEANWNREQTQLTGWPDFYDCWHHRLLFDVVNEVLLQMYNKSFPYYPKALSSSCRVHPIPVGNYFIEEFSTSICALLNFKPEEKESLDSIIAYDLENDYRWMNLQLESETVALDLEDVIFDQLLEEVIEFSIFVYLDS